MSKDISKQMRWHKDGQQDDDNTLRHPVDAIVCKEFDEERDWFARDSHNMRLWLASDGFNPFCNISTTYSMWPIVLTLYNLPMWSCMKAPNLILSLLILGPTVPGNEIDVYLQLLVDDFLSIVEWRRKHYDAPKKETFQLHVTLLWTINDFLPYENLFGWSTKDTTLRDGHQMCYMGHRRWLLRGHVWRKKGELVYSTKEHRLEPEELSRDQLLQQLPHVTGVQFGKENGTKRKHPDVVKLEKE